MVGFDPNERELSRYTHVAAGALSGIFTRTLSQPLDVLKIRFQLQVEPITQKSEASKYRSIAQSLTTIFYEEKLQAFWKGHASGQLLTAVYMGAEFTAFELSTKAIWQHLHKKELSLQQRSALHFVSGGIAGGIATIVSYPLDVIRTRFIAQQPGKGYNSMYIAVTAIYNSDGLRGFYRGLWAGLLHAIPQASLHFGCYETYKQILSPLVPDTYLGSVGVFSGAVAGVTSKLIVYPFDTTKRRLQVVGFGHHREAFGQTKVYSGVWSCISRVLLDEGIRGLYKGVSWALLKSGVSTSMYFYFYERFCQAFRYYQFYDEGG